MNTITINETTIGQGARVYIIAEMSANHNQRLDHAIEIIHRAKQAGADAVKLQTYTPETITLNCRSAHFKIKDGIWKGKYLHDLYQAAYTPWEWYPKLKRLAEAIQIDLFSTPFDATAVDFLETMAVPAYKIASFELIDIPLLKKVAKTGKPVILSTGMATRQEIQDATTALRSGGCSQLALLKCTSAYPAPPEEAHLNTIAHLANRFNVIVGLSDHTQGIAIPIAATALGACIIEKHFCLAKDDGSPDNAFSLTPEEFEAMVKAIRTTEKALGEISYAPTQSQIQSRKFRRSLFAVKSIKKGEPLNLNNIRSIRPGHGLPPKHLDQVIGRIALRDIPMGTPLQWDLIRSPDE